MLKTKLVSARGHSAHHSDAFNEQGLKVALDGSQNNSASTGVSKLRHHRDLAVTIEIPVGEALIKTLPLPNNDDTGGEYPFGRILAYLRLRVQ